MKLRQMIPQSSKPKPATPIRRTNASTSAAAMEEEEAEPTMRLSTAFIVVLLLHLVAIGGVYTFDAVKVNRASKGEAGIAEAKAEAPISPAAALASAGQETQAAAVAPKEAAAPVKSSAAASKATAAAAKPAATTKAAAVAASAEVHVVKKGENPLAIAKQHGVDYEALLKLNKIDDPRRLQIGQKLQIPVK